MARKKISEQHVGGPKHGGLSKSSGPQAARGKFRSTARQQDLNDVDREVLVLLPIFVTRFALASLWKRNTRFASSPPSLLRRSSSPMT